MFTAELAQGLPAVKSMGLVDVGPTMLITGGIFVVLMVLLRGLIFNPYLEIVEKRERLTEGTRDDASAMLQKAESTLNEYEEKMALARSEAASVREQLKKEGEAEEEKIVAQAREEASEEVEKRRKVLYEQVAEANRDLDARAKDLSSAIAERILSRA